MTNSREPDLAAMRAEVKAMPKGPQKKTAAAILKNMTEISALKRRYASLHRRHGAE